MVTLEFFGTSRLYTQVDKCALKAACFKDVAEFLTLRFPKFAKKCLQNEALSPNYLLCLNGETFIDASNLELQDGDTIIILSADAGG